MSSSPVRAKVKAPRRGEHKPGVARTNQTPPPHPPPTQPRAHSFPAHPPAIPLLTTAVLVLLVVCSGVLGISLLRKLGHCGYTLSCVVPIGAACVVSTAAYLGAWFYFMTVGAKDGWCGSEVLLKVRGGVKVGGGGSSGGSRVVVGQRSGGARVVRWSYKLVRTYTTVNERRRPVPPMVNEPRYT